MTQARDGIQDLKDMVETFSGTRGDQEHDEIEHYYKIYSDLLTIMASDMEEQEVGVDHSSCS